MSRRANPNRLSRPHSAGKVEQFWQRKAGDGDDGPVVGGSLEALEARLDAIDAEHAKEWPWALDCSRAKSLLAAFAASYLLATSAAAQVEDLLRQTVAAVIIAEAGGEGATGMMAVREVIANRARAGNLSEYGVVTKPKQFSCLNGQNETQFIARMRKHPKWAYAMQLASEPSKNDLTHGANHYYATWMKRKPCWADGRKQVARIGNHVFFKL